MPCSSHTTPHPAARRALTSGHPCAEPVAPYRRPRTPVAGPVSGRGRPGGWLGRESVAVARRFLAGAAAGSSSRPDGQARTETQRDDRLARVSPTGQAAAPGIGDAPLDSPRQPAVNPRYAPTPP